MIFPATSLNAKTITVPQDNPTIKEAVSRAQNGDLIVVNDGYYSEKNIIIDKAVHLKSKNLYGAVIDGGGDIKATIFIIRAAAEIEGFILKNAAIGIKQRDSPDVLWRGRHLAFINLDTDAVSINDRKSNIGRAELSHLLIHNTSNAFSMNDAGGMNISHCFISNLKTVFQGQNYLYFHLKNTTLWKCKNIINIDRTTLDYIPDENILSVKNVDKLDNLSIKKNDKLVDHILEVLTGRKTSLETAGNLNNHAAGLALNTMAHIFFDAGYVNKAGQLYQDALKSGRSAGSLEIVSQAYYGLGKIHIKKGLNTKALNYFQRSMETVEDMRVTIHHPDDRAGFLREKITVFDALIDLLYVLSQHHPKSHYHLQALSYSERSKARSFLDSLKMQNSISEETLFMPLVQEKEKVFKAISTVQLKLKNITLPSETRQKLLLRLDRLENRNKGLSIRLQKEYAMLNGLAYPNPLSLRGLRQNMTQKDTVFIEYYMGSDFLYGFMISQGQIYLARLGGSSEINERVRNFLHFLTFDPKGPFQGETGGKVLYDCLLKPLLDKARRDTKYLVIIPDGLLYRLPFETLIRTNGSGNLEKRFLIQDFAVSYAPSISSFFALIKKEIKEKNPKDLLAVACPDIKRKSQKTKSSVPFEIAYLYTDLPYLRFAGIEVKNASHKFKSKTLLNKGVTEGKIKSMNLSQYKIIHFATHGIMHDKNWARSALLLNKEKHSSEDGLLQPHEIMHLNLNADLVTLSCCHSGRGKILRGEGVLGLIRTFHIAGSRAVTASLWKINDKSTSLFMDHFYDYITEGLDKNQSLRLTKLIMITSRYKHPFYWAPFVLYGNYKSIEYHH